MHAFGPLSTLYHAADRPRAADAEIAWYAQHLPPGALNLQLMCGYGRLLVPLTASGCKVSGNATVRRSAMTGSSEGSGGVVDSAIK